MFAKDCVEESLRDKFKRLVEENDTTGRLAQEDYETIIKKFSRMSLQEMHEKVKEYQQELV